ncbi:MAG: ATP synthase F0 subunit B [Acidobacteriaceae bacterium]
MNLSRFFFLLLAMLCLAGALGLPARGLQAAPAEARTGAKSAPVTLDSPDEETGDDVYRHSASVKLLARWLHVDKETAARLFEYLNFAVLAGAILYALLKFLPKTFRANREDIQHRLVEARTATQQANDRLAAIEQRLARLDEEIAAIAKQAEKDSVEDEARIKASIETERERIVEAVSRDIAAASSAAQRDLKRFAAELAVDRAAQRMTLSEDDDRALVQEFSQSLAQQGRNGGKN